MIKNNNSYRVENLISIIENDQDIKLNPNERIYIFSKYDIDILAEKELFDYLKSEYDTTSKFSNCKSITQLKKTKLQKGM